jgi:hypothetical protein
MGKNRFLFPFLILFFVIYFFLFPQKVKEEYILVPEKKIVLKDGSSDIASTSQGNWSFRTPDEMGFYDEMTGVFHLVDGEGLSQISDRFYFTRNDDSFNLVSKSGEILTTLETSFVPVMQGDRFYLTNFFGGYLKEIDVQGRPIWEYTFPSMITCMDSKNGITAVGLLNGALYLFNGKGEVIYTWSPGGSRIDVIYGIALSDEGDQLAIVSGLDSQRFILIEKKENGYRPVFHENLSYSFRTPLSLTFTDSFEVIIEGKGEALFYDPGNTALVSFPIPGDFNQGGTFSEDGSFLFQSDLEGESVFSVFTDRGSIVAESFCNDTPFLMNVRDNKVLLSGQDKVFIIRREFH